MSKRFSYVCVLAAAAALLATATAARAGDASAPGIARISDGVMPVGHQHCAPAPVVGQSCLAPAPCAPSGCQPQCCKHDGHCSCLRRLLHHRRCHLGDDCDDDCDDHGCRNWLCNRCGWHGSCLGGLCPHCGILCSPCALPCALWHSLKHYHRGLCPVGVYCHAHAVNANYFDPRDGRLYAAQGYGIPVSVPLAPQVDFTYNYGWGIPASRLTPIWK